ncbi:MAG: cell division protein SepF [Ruminococcaceae bacterium]|nr:cell division protein SepF [Oscillospiraceae bacterium]
MSLLKKFLGDEDEMNEMESESTLQGYQDPSAPEDYSKPKPQFVLAKPEQRDELLNIADQLLNRKTVILNLELVTQDTRRFVDFLSGVAYALNGQVKKVAVHTYLIIPGGLEISGDIFDDIEGDMNF